MNQYGVVRAIMTVAMVALVLSAQALTAHAADDVPGFKGMKWGMKRDELAAPKFQALGIQLVGPSEDRTGTGRWIGALRESDLGPIDVLGYQARGAVFYFEKVGNDYVLAAYSSTITFNSPVEWLKASMSLNEQYPQAPKSRRTENEDLHYTWFLNGATMEWVIYRRQDREHDVTLKMSRKDFVWK